MQNVVVVSDASNAVQEFFAPIAAAKADSWEGTGLEGGGEAMSAVLDLIRQHKVSIGFCQHHQNFRH